jgi:hypothetical protein
MPSGWGGTTSRVREGVCVGGEIAMITRLVTDRVAATFEKSKGWLGGLVAAMPQSAEGLRRARRAAAKTAEVLDAARLAMAASGQRTAGGQAPGGSNRPAAAAATGVGAGGGGGAGTEAAGQGRLAGGHSWEHVLAVSELAGELLVGGMLTLGPARGSAREGAATGSLLPRKVPALLLGGGCWHLGCGCMAGCSERALRTHACAGCGLARYCGPACQRAHWPLHRAQCLRWRQELGGRAPELVDQPRPA